VSQSESKQHDAEGEQGEPLGRVPMSVTREEALGLLERNARRGKLPGFALEHEGFKCDAFGNPFDADLVGRFDNGEIVFVLRRKLLLPVVFWVLIVFAIWPGCWMVDSLCATYFSSYPWFGISGLWWQVIFAALTALAIPAVLKQQSASRKATREHGRETIEKIRGWVA
jgi:hypothetical protein